MKTNSDFFSGRRLLIVTKHQKEEVIAPLLEEALGVTCFVSKDFDTDSLGTFSGEIARKDDALTTLRKKCLEGMQSEGFDLAIATEGSFGNHPTVFFAPANDELIMLVDQKNNLEIVERVLSMDTNFDSSEIHTKEELKAFLDKVQFPSHAVIMKNAAENWTKIYKGITDYDSVEKIYNEIVVSSNSCFIETDMRAMFNPTRIKIIKEVSLKLIKKAQSVCPECLFPGFGVVGAEAGLLCSSCSMPTRSTSAHIYQCQHCNYKSKVLYPNGKKTEDPMYCDFCNP
ncbi:DUF6671 family protein [Flavobacterium cheniae]|uniref:DUF6671 domain-containing protein n=1 Tax=Flavobacterium cheniae TaxID=295428 RepID=A0A562KS06_9FLAO|nr:DUF6671 family protein [Flavobacterium cheniae]TDR25697.1 hypothetical protein C8D80_0474 [Flavobacterium cheniae]TWH98117.1 hypothetical protein IP97_00062 [Flavobacterium cheniae]